MLTEAIKSLSIVAKLSMFIGVVPLAVSVVYAIWPNEQRLSLMRPLSLATIFAAISSSMLGIVNVFISMGRTETPAWSRSAVLGLSEALVPAFFAFGCLTLAWLCVALGIWRKP